MAVYTVQVRTLIENHFDLGLKDYPLFDENYRAALNGKILGHYYFREIGFETAGLFKFYLNQKMSEIMPYYNQLYKSELLEFNPFYNVDHSLKSDKANTLNSSRADSTQTHGDSENTQTATGITNDTNSSTATNTSQQSNADKNVHSDTPQGLLGIDSIDNEVYASTADIGKNSSESTANSVGNSLHNSVNQNTQSGSNSNDMSMQSAGNTMQNGIENYISHVIGKEGTETYSEMLMKFRDTFLNIDMMIINELKDLFMNVY